MQGTRSSTSSLLPSLAAGALGGAVGGAVAAAVDAGLVLGATGAYWLRTADVLEPFAVYGVLGLLAGAGAGLVPGLLARGPRLAVLRRPGLAWALAATAVGTLGALAVLVFHWYDVVLGEAARSEPARYAAPVAAALGLVPLLGALTWLVGGRAARPGALAPGSLLLVAGFAATLLVARPFLDRTGVDRTGAAGEARPGAPDIALIVLDTTRVDALSAYGGTRETTPNLDALAAEGLLYTRAYAPGTWTSVSHASLFTGVYPSRHGTFSDRTQLGEELPTLAETLADAGYQTLFVSQKNLLRRADGWARGFGHAVTVNVEDRIEPVYRRFLRRRSMVLTPALVELTARWLERAEAHEAPWFVFLNLNDPHTRYFPREPWFPRYRAGLGLEGVDMERVWRLAHDQRPKEDTRLEPDEAALLRAVYDSEVAFMDAELGPLLEALRRARGDRPRVVLVTSDHGELLGEHGRMYHGKYPWEELVHVPLILWSRPSLATGVRDELVSLVDVLPTLLRLAGTQVAGDAALEGRDLLRDPAPEQVFAEHWERGERARRDGHLTAHKAAIGAREKLVWDSEEGSALFAVGERVPGQRPLEAGERAAPLDAALRERFDLETATAAPDTGEEQRRRLEALGYLH